MLSVARYLHNIATRLEAGSRRRTPSKRGAWLVACIAAAALVGAAVPAIASAAARPATYYACVNVRTGVIKVVSKSGRCRAGLHKISWNNVGPQGPAGPQGRPGVVKGYLDNGTSNVAITSSGTTLATLTVPSGSFLIYARVVGINTSTTAPNTIDCRLFQGTTVLDESISSFPAQTDGFGNVTLVSDTTTGGAITVKCYGTAITVSRPVITAIPVAALTVTSG